MEGPGFSTANNALVKQYTWNGGANQKWTIQNLGRGEYRIVNVNSGKSLDNPNSSRTVGTNVQQYTSNGNFAQKWHIIPCIGGYYRLVSVNTLGKTLGISNASQSDNAGVVISQFNFANDQQWQFVQVSTTAAANATVAASPDEAHQEEEVTKQGQTGLKTYPSPFTDKIRIALSVEKESNVTIGIYHSNTGEKVKDFTLEKLQPGNHEVELNGSDLLPGLYIYRTVINGKTIQGKLIKGN
jgi:hypothetical protein